MKRTIATLALLAVAACASPTEEAEPLATSGGDDGLTFSTEIDNPYLPLSKFSECTLEGEEDGAPMRIVRTLLDRPKTIEWKGQTIEATIVRDREYEDGELIEETLDYFAQGDDGAVYYLGEDVDDYEDGKVIGHEGEWLLGKDTDTPGVLMPADPKEGTKFRPEDVPDITTEDAVVDETDLELEVDAGRFSDVIKIKELHPNGVEEFKFYAKGTGLLREEPEDGRIDLVSCEKA